ncbi:MAG: glycosyltransferase [Bdellovibrionales bacterium]|nr:glycosyltransferase [Bdellovibrionales bacterium]
MSILKLHLQALKKQNLVPDLWEVIFVFKAEQNSKFFLDSQSLIKRFFPKAQILSLSLNTPIYQMRNLGFSCASSPLLYFLDEDVILERVEHLQNVMTLHEKHPSIHVIGGSYLSHPESSFFGHCYNWLVRIWMKKYQMSRNQDFVPAGNLSVKLDKKFSALFFSPNSSGFGSEEIFFLKKLHEEGFSSLWIKDIDAFHLAKHSFLDFIKRAWLQGKNLSLKKWFSYKNFKIFFSQKGSFLLKTSALFYLLFVRLSALNSKLKNIFLQKLI